MRYKGSDVEENAYIRKWHFIRCLTCLAGPFGSFYYILKCSVYSYCYFFLHIQISSFFTKDLLILTNLIVRFECISSSTIFPMFQSF